MARTIAEIKKEMTDAYISNSIIRDIYGITGDADFDSVFSPVSIESTLFYIFAATAHVIEQMFDQFKTDEECYQMMERLVEQMKAKQGVTAQLKSENQMQWVGMMNNIRHCAEEVVLKDIVYV